VDIPFQECLEQYLGITPRSKTVAQRFQLAAQFGVIVDLAVEDGDSIPILAPHGLVAAFEIDNLETNRAQ
jgi:hypothetical protein